MVYSLNVKPVNGYYVEVDALDGDVRSIEVVDPTPDGGLPFVGIEAEWADRPNAIR